MQYIVTFEDFSLSIPVVFPVVEVLSSFLFPKATFDIFSECTKNPKRHIAADFYLDRRDLSMVLLYVGVSFERKGKNRRVRESII